MRTYTLVSVPLNEEEQKIADRAMLRYKNKQKMLKDLRNQSKEPKIQKPKQTLKKIEKPQKVKKLVLYDRQMDWKEKSMKILETKKSYLDYSEMGCGKTPLSISNALDLGLPAIVVCTKGTLAVWEEETKKYGLNTLHIMTYEKLRGIVDKNLCHNLLERSIETIEGKNVINYEATAIFLKIAREGVFLIFDEMQKIRNMNSLNFQSAMALVNTINKCKNSKCAFLSGTPIELEEHVITLLHLLSIIKDKKLSVTVENTVQWRGYRELLDYCYNNTDDVETISDIEQRSKNTDKLMPFVVELYSALAPTFSGCMIHNKITNNIFDGKNVLLNLKPSQLEVVKKSVEYINEAIKNSKKTDRENTKGMITTHSRMAEIAKCHAAAAYATDILKNPKARVAIGVNFLSAMHLLNDFLFDYSPSLIYGKLSAEERDVSIKKFKSDESRVIIFIQSVCPGIDLSDNIGNNPTTMLVLPTYSYTVSSQCPSRIYRGETTKSVASCRFLYTNISNSDNDNDITEQKIALAIKNKTNLNKGVLGNTGRLPAPGDYPDVLVSDDKYYTKQRTYNYDYEVDLDPDTLSLINHELNTCCGKEDIIFSDDQ